MALGSTQPPTEMITREGKGGRWVGKQSNGNITFKAMYFKIVHCLHAAKSITLVNSHSIEFDVTTPTVRYIFSARSFLHYIIYQYSNIIMKCNILIGVRGN